MDDQRKMEFSLSIFLHAHFLGNLLYTLSQNIIINIFSLDGWFGLEVILSLWEKL